MKRHTRFTLAVWSVVLGTMVASCGGEQPAPETANANVSPVQTEIEIPDYVIEAATLANRIVADPQAAEATLSEGGWTKEQWEARMMQISRVPELTAAFEAARTN